MAERSDTLNASLVQVAPETESKFVPWAVSARSRRTGPALALMETDRGSSLGISSRMTSVMRPPATVMPIVTYPNSVCAESPNTTTGEAGGGAGAGAVVRGGDAGG